MVFKLTQQAQGKWRCINAPHLVKQVASGVILANGEAVNPPNNVIQQKNKEKTWPQKKSPHEGRRFSFF
jgi:hypothetical protein